MRRPRQVGKARKVPLLALQVGMQLREHIRGLGGKVLVQEGEVLTQKHLEQIEKWESRPGAGRLSLYTREVWAHATDASGDEAPACETNPYEAMSIQRNYKRGTKASEGREAPRAPLIRLDAAGQRVA